MRHTLWVFPETTTTATLASVCETLQPVFCTVADVSLAVMNHMGAEDYSRHSVQEKLLQLSYAEKE